MGRAVNSICLGTVVGKEGLVTYGTDILVDEEGEITNINWLSYRRINHVW